jgi:lipopolysaccharide/colanic/teichoic acid biosynthesis glycosyltransferase
MLLITPQTTGSHFFSRIRRSTSRHIVLGAPEFEMLLERERSLADRGTRVFSLLVLHRVQGNPLVLDRLSRQLVQRLRATDLVGQLDRDRIAVLLTDTDPVQARTVAGWIDRAVAALDVRVEPTLYVYPSISDADVRTNATKDAADGSDDHTPTDGTPKNHDGNGHTEVPDGTPLNGRRLADDAALVAGPVDAPAAAPAPAASWDVKDLWSNLAVPTPWWKRALDILVASIALLVLLPFFGLIALAIKLDSPGPVIFRQRRAGRGGQPFTFYKFRSMFVDAEKRRAELAALNELDGPAFKIRNDPRMTRIGRLMRRWSIDELPQLWNVFKGDFSLVGPRPPMLNEVPSYERWQRRRLSVSGGLTCIWQVSGRNEIAFEDWMRMDMRYIQRRGVWTDFRLLAQTVTAVLSGRGAY